MSFSSNIPVYGSVQLIDFDVLEPSLTNPPRGAILRRAWAKAAETERRLDFIDWLFHVVREPARLIHLRSDSLSAFLLSFEATLQILKHEAPGIGSLDSWLSAQPQYDLACRGVRTLRNLEAHINSSTLAMASPEIAYSRFAGGGDAGNIVAWRLPEITNAIWNSLKNQGRKLELTDLAGWNALAARSPATTLLRDCLGRLVGLIAAAGP